MRLLLLATGMALWCTVSSETSAAEKPWNVDHSCPKGQVLHIDGKCVSPYIRTRLFLFEHPHQYQEITSPNAHQLPVADHQLPDSTSYPTDQSAFVSYGLQYQPKGNQYDILDIYPNLIGYHYSPIEFRLIGLSGMPILVRSNELLREQKIGLWPLKNRCRQIVSSRFIRHHALRIQEPEKHLKNLNLEFVSKYFSTAIHNKYRYVIVSYANRLRSNPKHDDCFAW